MSFYPPGCSGTPFDEPCYCELCGLPEEKCICPECPVCGSVGDPDCYKEHGMVLTQEQIDSAKEQEAYWERLNREEGEFWANQAQEELPDVYEQNKDLWEE